MGLFRRFGRGLRNIGRAVVRKAGEAIEKVGDIVNSSTLTMLGIDMQLSNPPLYDKAVDVNDCSVEDTIQISKLCDMAREDAHSMAKKYEDQIVDDLKDGIYKFVDSLGLEDYDSIFDYEISDDFADDIHNTVSNYVSTRISLDSDKFTEILRVRDDARRESKTKEYVDSVLNEAKEELIKKSNRKRLAVLRNILNSLDSYFKDQEDLSKKTEQNLEEIKKHEGDIKYRENEIVNTVVDIAYMECIRTLTYKDL